MNILKLFILTKTQRETSINYYKDDFQTKFK